EFFGILSNTLNLEKTFTVVLSNPRAVTNANPSLSENPALVAPTLGPGATSRVDIVSLTAPVFANNRGFWNFARATNRLDERDGGQPCPENRRAGEMWVPLYLPGAVGPNTVHFRARQNFPMRPGRGAVVDAALDAGSGNA